MHIQTLKKDLSCAGVVPTTMQPPKGIRLHISGVIIYFDVIDQRCSSYRNFTDSADNENFQKISILFYQQ